MTHDQEEHPSPAHPTTATLELMAALRDDALADLGRLHLMFLLDTDHRCRFSYLRDAVNLTDDRLRRHLRGLRSHGYAATSRDTTGAGWAYLTPHGAARCRPARRPVRRAPRATGGRARQRDQSASGPARLVHPDEVAMTDTDTLIEDLDAVAAHLPLIATELRTHTLFPVRQHTFGALLIELGENLHQHVDTHRPPNLRSAPLKPSSANNSEPS
jgi:hypothetical protein